MTWLNTFDPMIDVSTYCNAACPQCHRNKDDGLGKVDWLKLGHWTLKNIQAAYPKKTLKRVRMVNICGTWGEPMMNPQIYEIAKYFIDNDTEVSIDTNGSLRSNDFWQKMANLGDKLSITFAVDGIDQEMHSFYRQKTVLKTVLDNMSIVAASNANVRVHTILFKHNQDCVYQIADMVEQHGAKSMYVTVSDRFEKGDKYPFMKNGKKYFLERVDNDTMRMAGTWQAFS